MACKWLSPAEAEEGRNRRLAHVETGMMRAVVHIGEDVQLTFMRDWICCQGLDVNITCHKFRRWENASKACAAMAEHMNKPNAPRNATMYIMSPV